MFWYGGYDGAADHDGGDRGGRGDRYFEQPHPSRTFLIYLCVCGVGTFLILLLVFGV